MGDAGLGREVRGLAEQGGKRAWREGESGLAEDRKRLGSAEAADVMTGDDRLDPGQPERARLLRIEAEVEEIPENRVVHGTF